MKAIENSLQVPAARATPKKRDAEKKSHALKESIRRRRKKRFIKKTAYLHIALLVKADRSRGSASPESRTGGNYPKSG